ncbi:hypothetical protein SRHO_G00071690 [Serrasalmus rhombeus]
MALHSASDRFPPSDAPAKRLCQRSESSDDDDRRLKRREKNRVAAQRSRKRQTQRADELHEAYECLEQQNSLLKKEVQLLLEEQKRLAEALQSHEPLCPILNSGLLSAPRTIDVISP